MTVFDAIPVRSGASYWRDGYAAMLRFEMRNLRTYLTVGLAIQILLGAGMALMYGYYFGDMSTAQQTFLVTGIPTLALIPIGFVMVPNAIVEHRLHDTYDYVWSLPVPRMSSALATFTVFTVLAIPGTAIALLIASLTYDVTLQPTWAIVPAVILTAGMATSVGYAIGHSIPDPRVVSLFTNMVLFLVLLFSPIVAAIELFPEWWATFHHILPFWHMSVVIRAALTDGLVTTSVAASYVALLAWTAVSWSLASLAVGRRR